MQPTAPSSPQTAIKRKFRETVHRRKVMGGELFYRDAEGNKRDAELHAEFLTDGGGGSQCRARNKAYAVLAKPLADFGGVRFAEASPTWLEAMMPDVRKLVKAN